VPDRWWFSPRRLRGHRDRLRLSRSDLAARTGISPYTIKAYEQGLAKPSLDNFLLLIGCLGISPGDLCRTRDDDEAEYMRALHWSPPPPTLTRRQ